MTTTLRKLMKDGTRVTRESDADDGLIITVSCVAGEENSRVQAHIDENEFSAHILTSGSEYNIEVSTSAGCRT